ncbi:MAG: hypothetical protein ACR2QG_02470, partial [Gammaproteobacteria bacterium]
MAQRMIVNAQEQSFQIKELTGEGNGFHVIQMDAEPGLVTIATTHDTVDIDGAEATVSVACKMVNRDRVNDVLKLNLGGQARTCQSVNKYTYAEALETLTPEERRRYLEDGRKLFFEKDYVTASGGEWLPSAVHDFIDSSSQGLRITAPSVQVEWDPDTREFYQGTHHCKLIALSAMQKWMQEYAFTSTKTLVPIAEKACTQPVSMTSSVGSCRFWFAPTESMFCQDYSGNGWTQQTAQAECAKRHASPE